MSQVHGRPGWSCSHGCHGDWGVCLSSLCCGMPEQCGQCMACMPLPVWEQGRGHHHAAHRRGPDAEDSEPRTGWERNLHLGPGRVSCLLPKPLREPDTGLGGTGCRRGLGKGRVPGSLWHVEERCQWEAAGLRRPQAELTLGPGTLPRPFRDRAGGRADSRMLEQDTGRRGHSAWGPW